jgi:colanic acid/amylovoran biosynthesis protein
MTRIYLTGHTSFGNRGCEAIVRSTVKLLEQHLGRCQIYVPSADIARDRAQWPQADEHGVQFVRAFKSPHNKYWRHLQRLPLAPLKRMGWPFPLSAEFKKTIAEVDAVLSIGGDNYSLDYLIPSLLMGMDAYAMARGVPVALWGASVGPFDKEPAFVPYVREHLARMAFIGARESITETYLTQTMTLPNVISVADPAFALEPEPIDVSGFWPRADGEGVLGFNVSPLIRRYRPNGEAPEKLVDEIAAFLDHVTRQMAVLLVPHVIPLNGASKNNDAHFMAALLERVRDRHRVTMMDSRLNAAQIKGVIARCRFFIGARTHATIAALSSRVPTISIAYSVKAKGINRDLFGHTDYVLDTPEVDRTTLRGKLELLLERESCIRSHLDERIPHWQTHSARSAQHLAALLTPA